MAAASAGVFSTFPVAVQPVASGLITAPGPSEILELTGGKAGVEAGVSLGSMTLSSPCWPVFLGTRLGIWYEDMSLSLAPASVSSSAYPFLPFLIPSHPRGDSHTANSLSSSAAWGGLSPMG